MLHELLLALVGCTGDIFMDVKEQAQALGLAPPKEVNGDGEEVEDECTFRLAADITFLPEAEREQLNRLLRLGFYYRELDRFTVRCRNLSWIKSPYPDTEKGRNGLFASAQRQKSPSVYRRALANGIAEVLAVYRSAILKVEQNLLSDPVPVLALVTQGLNQFEILLPPLYALMREVEREELKGGRLLNLLHVKCHCGGRP